ncbi:MAG: Sec-independent protein translocase protein TatB [Gammaproteobacteria bacterium]|nr:Sec-independent protein translocase protein TatB [Gammaproteobacteria bacterium]MBU2059168.1 Sec-independent protein translocase protein TatB [Gammaproteobacteria bacterium]MBU2173719.1 Sec-independent protein translocase protein TatB [Gammaproteobacteria bacterium]MBU2246875.1 Sec-independent protein translocase protein TatB [Gammaproteobacteria bacterium]MBU2343445.1 Sec-independent protein translocase protein TatB [Gammaproteobacteria bacterium]
MSFWELVIIAVVALLVLGPERLPGAIRSVSGFVRSVKQFGQQMQAELNDELRVQELHDKLKQAEEKGLLNLTTEEMQAMTELRQAAADVTSPYAKSSSTTEPQTTAADTMPPLPSATPDPVVTDDKNHKS